MEQLLNEKDAARRLDVSVQLLRKWRATRIGPVHMKLGEVRSVQPIGSGAFR